MPTRRRFLRVAAGAALAGSAAPAEESGSPRISLGNARLQSAYDAALAGLSANIQSVDSFPMPLLFEGATYLGAWLECAPLEGLVYAPIALAVARANHEVYFHLQRQDGQFPCSVRKDRIGWAQIQMVVPVAATTWDLYRRDRDAAFLERAYSACTRWDQWLMRYRNTRGTGLCEAFCEYDTGHDNSPRFRGKPKQCPNGDARLCPPVEACPIWRRTSPPLYTAGAWPWRQWPARWGAARKSRAGWSGRRPFARPSSSGYTTRVTERFYDIDAGGRFVRIRGDAITRVLGEHVVDRKMFEHIWSAQLHNPKAFWTPYPFPSIAADDPTFVRPIPRNSWGGAAQALTALRTPRWMEHYSQPAALRHVMSRWDEALVRSGSFLQQLDPQTGEFSADRGGYSPAMLALFDFSWRLYGVRAEGGELEWNCRLPEGSAECVSSVAGAELRTTAAGSVLSVSGREVLSVEGEVRVVTRADGTPLRLVGTAERESKVRLRRDGQETHHLVRTNQVVKL